MVARVLKQVDYKVAVNGADVYCTHFGDATARSRKIYLAFPEQEMPDENNLDIGRPDILPERSGWSGWSVLCSCGCSFSFFSGGVGRLRLFEAV